MRCSIENLDSVKFVLTPKMSLELINFNKLKKELSETKKLYNLSKNKELLLKIKNLELRLNNSRNEFINEFRRINENEIEKYLKSKDQSWSFFLFTKDFGILWVIIYL